MADNSGHFLDMIEEVVAVHTAKSFLFKGYARLKW